MIVKFARWIVNRFDRGNLRCSNEAFPTNTKEALGSHILDRRNAVTFTVHTASGGYVVESSFYRPLQDRYDRNLHIITSKEDFAQELGHAVLMDMLKNQ